jgi:glycosyltransferase involved in cell wall biosynthesis
MSAPLRVALVTTHPVQYQAPWLRALARRPELDLTVLYALLPTPEQQGIGFGRAFAWDVPLLEGYRHELLANVARPPGLGRFGGCDTPGVGARLDAGRFEAVIVVGWHTKSGLQALLACRRRGIPCLVRGDSNALKPRPLAVRLAHRLLLRQYAAFLVVGASNREFYRRAGVPEERLFFAPHCVDHDRFAAQADELRPRREALRAGFGLPAEACVFLFCGKLIAKKRPLDLLEAFARVHARHPDARLLVVGDGELRPALAARAGALGVPVACAGFLNQSEIARAYVAADALVLPSDYGETWGLVVNEAMACGLPAIVSERVGCHPDLVLPGETGVLVKHADVDALAAALDCMARDPQRARALGRAARAHAARWSLANLVTGTLQALRYAVPRA